MLIYTHISRRNYIIEPEAPENRELRVGTDNTVEETEHDEEERKDVGDDRE